MRALVCLILTLATPVIASTACVISEGGVYRNLVCESNDPNKPAIAVNTTARVTIDKATINHRGVGVAAVGVEADTVEGYRIAITNSKFTALDPQTPVLQQAVEIVEPFEVLIQNNSFVNGHGIVIQRASTAPVRSVLVRLNDATNIGYYGRPDELLNFLSILGGVYQNLEVAWNRVTNIYGQSNVEENINFYRVSGTRAQPFEIHHNLIDGAWPAEGEDPNEYTGGGMLIGDGDETSNSGSFGKVHSNRVINTAGHGIAIAGGTDFHLYANRVVSDGKANNGMPVSVEGPAGIWIDHYAGKEVMTNTIARDNLVGVLGANGGRGEEYYLPKCNPPGACVNNVRLSGMPTSILEQAERSAWEKELAANKLTVGPNW